MAERIQQHLRLLYTDAAPAMRRKNLLSEGEAFAVRDPATFEVLYSSYARIV